MKNLFLIPGSMFLSQPTQEAKVERFVSALSRISWFWFLELTHKRIDRRAIKPSQELPLLNGSGKPVSPGMWQDSLCSRCPRETKKPTMRVS